MATSVPQLDYARPRRRRRWGRVAILCLILGCAGAVTHYHKPIWRRAQVVYWERQCMSYEPPAGAVTHEADPLRAAALLAAGPDYERTPNGKGALLRPRCWRNLEALMPRLAGLTNWMPSPGVYDKPATLFLHERRSKGGVRRLVHLQSVPGA